MEGRGSKMGEMNIKNGEEDETFISRSLRELFYTLEITIIHNHVKTIFLL